MKIQLLNLPEKKGYSGGLTSGWDIPLAVTSIANYLIKNIKNVEVQIIDNAITPNEKIKKLIDADLIGISTSITSYKDSLEIAKLAKKKGAKVIYGGAYASSVAENILKNRSFIDFVIIGEAEKPFLDLVKGKPLEKIPNLVYRKNNKIIKNFYVEYNLDEICDFNRNLIPVNNYFKRYKESNKKLNWPFKKPMGLLFLKGCPFKYSTGGCVFCAIPYSKPRFRSPKKIWEEISYLVKEFKVDLIFAHGDTSLQNKNWLKEILKQRPKNINVAFYILGRADEIDKETVEILSKLNVFNVYLGVETGSQKMLDSCFKGVKKEQVIKAIELLTAKKINFHASFVLGLPGETEQTALETLEFAKQLKKYPTLSTISVSILIPLPTSKAFSIMLQNLKLSKKYLGKDILDINELRKDWVDNYCKATFNFLKEIEQEMRKITKGSFGFVDKTKV